MDFYTNVTETFRKVEVKRHTVRLINLAKDIFKALLYLHDCRQIRPSPADEILLKSTAVSGTETFNRADSFSQAWG